MNRLAHSASVLVLSLSLSGGALAVSKEEADSQAAPAPAETEQPLRPTIAPTPAAPLAEEAAKPAAKVPAEDAVVAAKIQELVEGKLNPYVTREKERAGVVAFYRERGYAPIWVSNNAQAQRAKDAITALRAVAANGLDPDDYPTPSFSDASPERLAADELRLTGSLLTYVRHASTGRVAYSRVSGSIYYDLQPPDTAEVLGKLATASDTRALLDSFQPQHAAYKALKAELAAIRAGKEASEPKQAAKDEAPAKSSKGKRKAEEPKPQAASSKSARIDTIIANMERWRWVPRNLGTAHVVVNIPDYTLRLLNNGKTVWGTRIVVGKPGSHATPLLTETMKYITVNPTWNVPPSIIRNEYLPALARDPGALARIGLQIGRNADGSIRIYQPPGEKNALGRIRFNFPNRFLVYQHDTPDKHLFDHTVRAYSHGCMRVQNPDQYAEALLSVTQPEDNYTAQRVRGMYGHGERSIQFKTQIPVHITYQTAFVDEAGKLQTRADIYGLDKEITTVLRDERKVADVPVARNHYAGSKPVMGHAPETTGRGRPALAAQPGWGWNGGYSQADRFRTW
jgi:murein L,D-transpeptidase YcbB/YkuD